MNVIFNNQFWNNTMSNALGTILSTLITGIFGYWVFKPLRQWLYKQNPKLANLLLKLYDFSTNPILWLVAFFVFQMMIFFDVYKFVAIIATSIILVRFYLSSKRELLSYPSKSAEFYDGFDKQTDIARNWETIT